MQTHLAETLKDDPRALEAESILRACVHCGLCNATCPTYQLLGDERDGPRGRIYLMKQVIEGKPASEKTRLHLDRCLSCRSCEATCPSGVDYSRLLDLGRLLVEGQTTRPWVERLERIALRKILPYPGRFAPLLKLSGWLRPMLPHGWRNKIPVPTPKAAWPTIHHPRRMLVLEGCVQSKLAPSINAAAARLLDSLGISLIAAPGAGCCGAISHHLSAPEEALAFMRRNIDAWLPYLEQGAEAIVTTASGCGLMVKEYGHVFKSDPDYAEKAEYISSKAVDLAEVLMREDLSQIPKPNNRRIAYQSPCTLQHGQKLGGVVEEILERLGFELVPVANPHLCCGSAGTYSILQPELSRRLLQAKLETLQAGSPECIATANIGCLAHLQSASRIPVRHWVELL